MNQGLNLARKWRPKTFDSIVGQDISVRMLKNSLYQKKFFPVYLFAGQRGCGKTSSARVFAAAINCHKLPIFQEKPTEQAIPCLKCDSCTAMINGNHPDFIEIDAASHTGVDNVRQIIENATYVPLAGSKKIYLIDEAHMLSKAAFNAFLKILEEPPETVLFILATTELHKFPDTVLSRCFQLTFGPIKQDPLKKHLLDLCSKENITIEPAALESIVEETEGSARDAINLLEQVRFASDNITAEHVLTVLGKISNTVLLTIFSHILDKKPEALLAYLQEISFNTLTPQTIWNSLVALCRSLLWVKYGALNVPNSFKKNIDDLKKLSTRCSINRLHAIMQLLWSQESLFLQTNQKHTFLELILLQLCEQTNVDDIKQLLKDVAQLPEQSPQQSPQQTPQALPQSQQSAQMAPPEPAPKQAAAPLPAQQPAIPPSTPSITASSSSTTQEVNSSPEQKKWALFVNQITTNITDQLLKAILAQAVFINIDTKCEKITIRLSSNSVFIKDKLEESKEIWLTPLRQHFPQFSSFLYAEAKKTPPATKPLPKTANTTNQKDYQPVQQYSRPQPATPGYSAIDVSDAQKWPLANLILKHFPGKIKKVNVIN